MLRCQGNVGDESLMAIVELIARSTSLMPATASSLRNRKETAMIPTTTESPWSLNRGQVPPRHGANGASGRGGRRSWLRKVRSGLALVAVVVIGAATSSVWMPTRPAELPEGIASSDGRRAIDVT